MNWFAFRFIFGKAIRTMQFHNPVTERIPISRLRNKNEQLSFINLADKMPSFSKKLQEIGELVYQLYGKTEEEKKVNEESLR